MNDKMLLTCRMSKRRPEYWLRHLFTLGLWHFWWRNDYLGLTKASVVRRRGVFTKEERVVPLNQVQDISISHGIVRRLLGHGDIRIETAGSTGTEIIMKNIDRPEEFRARVLAQIDEFYDGEKKA